MRPLPPAPWRGFTIDDIDRVDEVIAVVKKLPFRPICRVVIDYPERKPVEYRAPIARLAQVCDVMVQVRDSYAEKIDPLSVAAYVDLFEALFILLDDYAVIYEIGNEVNGNWLPSDIAEKVRKCYSRAQTLSVRTAVTFFLETPGGMGQWAVKNDIRCDVAMISWYPRSNPGFNPQWDTEVALLAGACGGKVAGGEFGSEDARGNQGSIGVVVSTITAVERTVVHCPPWIQGWFFWDFVRWCLPARGRGNRVAMPSLCLTAWAGSFRQ